MSIWQFGSSPSLGHLRLRAAVMLSLPLAHDFSQSCSPRCPIVPLPTNELDRGNQESQQSVVRSVQVGVSANGMDFDVSDEMFTYYRNVVCIDPQKKDVSSDLALEIALVAVPKSFSCEKVQGMHGMRGKSIIPTVCRMNGKEHTRWALDYFVLSRNLFQNVPDFAFGRPAYDNCVIEKGLPVVDASNVVLVFSSTCHDISPQLVLAIHQAHNYAHVNAKEKREAENSEEE
eukprot:766289-Hanusia_phi.AAC.1